MIKNGVRHLERHFSKLYPVSDTLDDSFIIRNNVCVDCFTHSFYKLMCLGVIKLLVYDQFMEEGNVPCGLTKQVHMSVSHITVFQTKIKDSHGYNKL